MKLTWCRCVMYGGDHRRARSHAGYHDAEGRRIGALLSEERLQNILNSMEEVVWSSSLDFSEVLYVSPAVMKIYGVASADFIVHPSLWIDMIHPADRLIAEAAIRDTAEGRAFDVQYRIVRPDGGIRWIRDRGRIIRDEQGQALRIDGVAADVTEKRTAEQALRGAEERFEDIFEASKDAIGYASLDGTVVLANDAFARLTGYSKQELLTRTYRDLTPPEYREIQAEVIAGVLKTGEPREYEKVYVQRDGSRIPVSLTVFAVKGEDGRPAGVAAIVRDITERKKTEEALRTSAARLQSAIAAANVGTWMVDLKTKMDTRDSGLNRMLGLLPVESSQPLEDFIGRIHPEDRAACAQAWAEAIEVTRIYDVTHRIIRGDGEIRWFRNRGQVAVDAEDRPLHAIGACVDVTDQRNLEEQLRRTERIAELGTLASGMAHEIGTPMNVILGRAEYLMQRVKEEPIKRGLQTIVGQVERITRVMNQLLSFARRRTPERRSLDLKGTIEDNLEIFEERLARAQVRLEVSFPDSCPPVHADPDQMSQVLINLVMNAIHAMPDGGTLRIGLTPASGRVLLTVSDTGHGIPKDVIAKIFDPFFTTKEFGKGTGLGLTVVKGIIEEHQGTIVVESEPNRGTTFTISLPIHKGL
ncbi:MAG: PAS domain S-box protein [Nitrospiraceae bacterium]